MYNKNNLVSALQSNAIAVYQVDLTLLPRDTLNSELCLQSESLLRNDQERVVQQTCT